MIVADAYDPRVPDDPRTCLESPDHRCPQFSYKERIFHKALGDAPPARIAGRDIEHRRERPMNPFSTRFLTGDCSSTFDELRIPGGGLSKGNRKNGTVPMNHIAARTGEGCPNGSPSRRYVAPRHDPAAIPH